MHITFVGVLMKEKKNDNQYKRTKAMAIAIGLKHAFDKKQKTKQNKFLASLEACF